MMRVAVLLLCLTLAGCGCDYKVQYDAPRNNYWVYDCGFASFVRSGPFDTYDQAAEDVRRMRKSGGTRYFKVP